MHQGLKDSNSGDYIQDKSAIAKDDVAGRRVISGHYHQRQDIKLPEKGLWSYVGNPYSLNYGEANDPEKGYQILYEGATLEFIPTKQRRHTIFNLEKANNEYWQITGKRPLEDITSKDLLWVKVTGSREDLTNMTKDRASKILGIEQPFKLDLIPADTTTQALEQARPPSELLDSLIDSLTNTSDEAKIRLKDLWKGM